MSGAIIVETLGDALRATITRPEKKNALNADMFDALSAVCERAGAEDVGALVIQGAGQTFTAGADIADFLAAPQTFENAPALRFIRALAACPAPIVAAVAGDAVGVGVTLLLHCDLVYAAPSARFRAPFVDLGLVPEAGATLLLPQRVGRAKANEMLLLGDGFGADEAQRLGLVNAIVPADDLAEEALRQARRLARKPRAALRATRALLRGDGATLRARIEEEAQRFAQALRGDEARAALAAFLARDKRDP